MKLPTPSKESVARGTACGSDRDAHEQSAVPSGEREGVGNLTRRDTMDTKKCELCKGTIVRSSKESPSRWNVRKFCKPCHIEHQKHRWTGNFRCSSKAR